MNRQETRMLTEEKYSSAHILWRISKTEALRQATSDAEATSDVEGAVYQFVDVEAIGVAAA